MFKSGLVLSKKLHYKRAEHAPHETNGTARTDSTPDAGSADVRPQFINQIHINKYVLREQLIMNDKWSVLRKPCARICVYARVSGSFKTRREEYGYPCQSHT